MIKAAFTALAALAVTSTALAAAPENPLAKDKVVLDLRKLDLATVQGQHLLAIRMDQAARDVCGDRLDTVHLSLAEQSRSCQAAVIADIRSRIEARTADAGRSAAPTLIALR